MKKITLILALLIAYNSYTQTVLKADKTKSAYEHINNVLAPGYDVVETPDCKHVGFGEHITQQWDDELLKDVFVFHSHVNEDNDRCKKDDRARTEIKTYNQSPDNLLGNIGETVIYKWKFKIENDFLPSKRFTHIHQIKAVGGSEDKMPTITISLRKTSKTQKIQVLHAGHNDQVEIASADLELFKGNWVAVNEEITYGEFGKAKYSIQIKNLKTNEVLLKFESDKLRMWKTDADFLRPKWGIYRSIVDADTIKDEKIFFADFSIEEK